MVNKRIEPEAGFKFKYELSSFGDSCLYLLTYFTFSHSPSKGRPIIRYRYMYVFWYLEFKRLPEYLTIIYVLYTGILSATGPCCRDWSGLLASGEGYLLVGSEDWRIAVSR
jgi:hypothetical protein